MSSLARRVVARVVSVAEIERLRDDLDALLITSLDATDYREAMQLKDSMDVFRERLLATFKAGAQSLEEDFEADEDVADDQRAIERLGEELYRLLEVPIHEPSAVGGEYADESDEEEEYWVFAEDMRDDWLQEVEQKAKEAFDFYLWAFQQWPTSQKEVIEPLRRAIEGFQTLLVGFDPEEDSRALEFVQAVLKDYRKRARRMPLLLKLQRPLELRFDEAGGSWIAKSSRGRIQVHVSQLMKSGFQKAVHILAHEMGHVVYDQLQTEALREWARLEEPISPYGKTAPEEAWAEAVGYLVGYGSRTINPRVLDWVSRVTPVRIAADWRGTMSLAERVANRFKTAGDIYIHEVEFVPGQDDVVEEYLSLGEDFAVPVLVDFTVGGRTLARAMKKQERVLEKALQKAKPAAIANAIERSRDIMNIVTQAVEKMVTNHITRDLGMDAPKLTVDSSMSDATVKKIAPHNQTVRIEMEFDVLSD